MACEVEIQPTAEAELDEIVAYLSSLDKSAALGFLEEWEEKLDTLRDGRVEFAYSRFPALAALGYRAYWVKKYAALYFREDKKAVIAHIFHGSRNYARLVV